MQEIAISGSNFGANQHTTDRKPRNNEPDESEVSFKSGSLKSGLP
jgi:hypothetical protein